MGAVRACLLGECASEVSAGRLAPTEGATDVAASVADLTLYRRFEM